MIPPFILMLGCVLVPAVQEAAFRNTVTTLRSSTEKVWEAEFARRNGAGIKYKTPGLKLFQTQVATACGTSAGSAVE